MQGWLFGVFVITACCIIHASGCSPITDYRLVTKTTPNSGIIEVSSLPDLGWGVICNTSADLTNIDVATSVCERLNYPGISRVLFASDFNDNGDEWPLSVISDAAALLTCGRKTINNTEEIVCWNRNTAADCRQDRILAVTCREPGYVGCFNDYGYRFYPGGQETSTKDNSPAYCVKWCKGMGFSYAGVYRRDMCSCMSRDGEADIGTSLSDKRCSHGNCPGDPRESCGGRGLMAIYDVDLGFCKDPGTPASGFRSGDWFRFGSRVKFTCSEGTRLVGANSIQCIRNASGGPHDVEWSAPIPICSDQLLSTTPNRPTTTRLTTNSFNGGSIAAPRVLEKERLVHGLITSVLLLYSIVVTVVLVKYRRSYRALLLLNTQPTGRAAEDVTYTGLQPGARSTTEGAYFDLNQGCAQSRDTKHLSDSVLYESLNDGVISTIK